jgi:hypothetical protein
MRCIGKGCYRHESDLARLWNDTFQNLGPRAEHCDRSLHRRWGARELHLVRLPGNLRAFSLSVRRLATKPLDEGSPTLFQEVRRLEFGHSCPASGDPSQHICLARIGEALRERVGGNFEERMRRQVLVVIEVGLNDDAI